MRKRAKVDSTHGPIVEAFRAGGWSVLSLAPLGGGAPDLLIQHPACDDLYLIEVKAGKGQLRKAQEDFARSFTVKVLRSAEEAIEFMKGTLGHD